MISPERFMLLTLVLMRMSGCILFNPIFGRRNLPMIYKSGLIMVLTYIVFLATQSVSVQATTVIEYGVLLLKEFAVGYVIGFIINLFFYVIIFAGEIIDTQMGLSMSKIYDPQSNTSLSLSASFYNALFILLFFASDGHLALLKILINSENVISYGNVWVHTGVATAMLDVFRECSMMAVKFSFPILGIELLSEVGVGILMKTIPQINVFVVNIQMKLFIGLILLLLLFTPMSDFLESMMGSMFDTIQRVMNLMH